MLAFFFACATPDDATSESDAPASYACDELAQADGTTSSGLTYCSLDDTELGYFNRTSAEACAGDPQATVPACHTSDGGVCSKDADCPSGQVCGANYMGGGCICFAVCGSDADCSSGQTCLCALDGVSMNHGGGEYVGGSVDQCLPSTCRTGADCASGECGAAPNECGQGGDLYGFFCRTAADECRSNDDCAPPTPVCTMDQGKGHWTCQEGATCE
jgi:hypothetical protein